MENNLLKKLFKNHDLLSQALTHRSWVNEHPKVRNHNERLEFLGDAVLELVITESLYHSFPKKPEGYLTALRSNLVNTQNLADLATKLKVGKSLFLSKGEEEGGGRTNPSLLANTLEAVIGALYLDQGLETVRGFIKDNLLSEIPEKITKPLKDPKSRLQEYVQAKGLPTPKYKVLAEEGPDHDKQFIVEVFIANNSWGTGKGKSKSEAEQESAKKALNEI